MSSNHNHNGPPMPSFSSRELFDSASATTPRFNRSITENASDGGLMNTSRSVRSISSSLSTNSISNADLLLLPPPKSPYGSLTQTLRRMVPQNFACKIGCGGTSCKYCNSDWDKDNMALNGVYSHWITDDILAMARPTKNLIEKHNLIHQMKKAHIRSIFNLQTRDEHKNCGSGVLKETGFSYDPNEFTKAEIYYYNYELEDFSSTNMERMLDIVKVFSFALTEGKVAVHCHAGLGRTGLLIVCYLIFDQRMTADSAINFIRDRRKNAVQMTGQIVMSREFENYLNLLRVVFTTNAIVKLPPKKKFYLDEDDETMMKEETNSGIDDQQQQLQSKVAVDTHLTLNSFIHRQRKILHGKEAKLLKHIPKLIYVCCKRLKKLNNNWRTDDIDKQRAHEIQKAVNSFSKDLYESSTSSKSDTRLLSKNKYSSERRGGDELTPNIMIARAFASNHFGKKTIRDLQRYQKLLNESNEAYDEIANDDDPYVLTALIWSWLDQLKEPVLRDQEVKILLKYFRKDGDNYYEVDQNDQTPVNWSELDKNTLETIRELVSVVSDLLPLPQDVEEELLSQLLSSLTHLNVDPYKQRRRRRSFDDDYDLNNKSDHASATHSNDNNKIYYPNASEYMKTNLARLLLRIFKEFARKRSLSGGSADGSDDSKLRLGKFNFAVSGGGGSGGSGILQKSVSYYDYEEAALNEDYNGGLGSGALANNYSSSNSNNRYSFSGRSRSHNNQTHRFEEDDEYNIFNNDKNDRSRRSRDRLRKNS